MHHIYYTALVFCDLTSTIDVIVASVRHACNVVLLLLSVFTRDLYNIIMICAQKGNNYADGYEAN